MQTFTVKYLYQLPDDETLIVLDYKYFDAEDEETALIIFEKLTAHRKVIKITEFYSNFQY